jgi:tellurite resistance protein
MTDLEKFAARYQTDVEHVRRWIIEAMVLGAVSDGKFDRDESDSIIKTISEHAEFTGMAPDQLRADLERAFEGIVKDGFHVRLHALAGALPGYANRVLAFRCATRVAFANGVLDPDEIDFLRQMQKVLGISEPDVARAFEDGQGGSAEILDADIEPVEAYLDCLLMAAAADKELRDEELATIIAFVISRDEFAGIDEDHLREYINDRLRNFATGGTARRLDSLSADLPEAQHRENAYGLAVSISVADGELAPEERTFLIQLRRALHLDEERAGKILNTIGQP